jgi:mono/diheme cytochrome c family protein
LGLVEANREAADPYSCYPKGRSTKIGSVLFDIVHGGGEAVGKTRLMPPFGFQLNDQEVWDIVAYMRTLGK